MLARAVKQRAVVCIAVTSEEGRLLLVLEPVGLEPVLSAYEGYQGRFAWKER